MKAKLLTSRGGIGFTQAPGQEIEIEEEEFLRMYIAGQCEPACPESTKAAKQKAVKARQDEYAREREALLAGERKEKQLHESGRRRGRLTATDEARETTDALAGELDPNQD